MINDKGNGAMNQFVLYGDGKIVFQSYSSMIAEIDEQNDTITIGADWNYSRTTGKHRNIFFRDYARIRGLADTKALQKAIKDGSYNDGCVNWVVKMA